MNDDAIIVEVGLNESVSPTVQPNVAQSPSACAADALRCADAGAAIVHWHAVDALGKPRLADTELYGAALDLIDGRILAYPSYPTDVADVVTERLAHCLALRERNGLEIAPIDVATVNLVLWDGRSGIAPVVPTQGLDVIRNSLPFVVDALRQYRSVGLVPTLAAFDLGSTRTIAALAAAGLLDSPILLKIFLWGSPCIGPEPSVEALELHLRQRCRPSRSGCRRRARARRRHPDRDRRQPNRVSAGLERAARRARADLGDPGRQTPGHIRRCPPPFRRDH